MPVSYLLLLKTLSWQVTPTFHLSPCFPVSYPFYVNILSWMACFIFHLDVLSCGQRQPNHYSGAFHLMSDMILARVSQSLATEQSVESLVRQLLEM
ncbi:MAG: hypothetical protein EOM43_09105, partial [Gammaproteobacteria bacterium]|nr:hypothetical protein [Gammaproteobacteria bacterium]